MTDDTTCDDFLGGRLQISQPKSGYRAGVDAVLLAAATNAKAGQAVLELGCGVGVASLCLATRVPGITVTGVELQPDYAALAQKNAAHNQVDFHVHCADLRQLPHAIRQERFDHVIMNPPYFLQSAGHQAADDGRAIALSGETPLADWLDIGARRLAPKGYLTLIQRIERLPDVLSGLSGRLGSVVVLPIAGRVGRDPNLFLLSARQGGKAAFRMAAPLIMHRGATHQEDRESYTEQVQEILRSAAALFIPG